MQKTCPRCHSSLECKGNDINLCPCTQIKLSKDCQDYLNKTRYDCLCPECLVELNELVSQSKNYQFPLAQSEWKKDLHFYNEGNHIVMTELYHIIRGHCCKSGCRHCAYGYDGSD